MHRLFLGVASLLGVSVVAADPPPDWPRFLGRDFSGAAAVGDSSYADRDWSTPPLAHWQLSVADGYGLGVVWEGSYYHFDAPDKTQRLRRVDLETGKVLWSVDDRCNYRDLYGYEPGPRCTPTLDPDAGLIYTYGVDGLLTARDFATGQQRWQIDLNDRFGVVQNFFGVGSSPLTVGDTLVVMVGGSPAADQSVAPGALNRVSPAGSLLVGLDKRTGKVRWATGDDLASYSSPRPIVLDGRTIVLVFARDHLHAIDPVAGQSLGRIYHRADILESVNAIVPVVSGNRVLVSDCYDLGTAVYDLKLAGGQVEFTEVWKDPPGRRREQSLRSHLSTPVLHEGFLYACSGRNAPDSDFRCVDFNTGTVRWTALERGRTTATRLGEVLLIVKESGPLVIARATPQRFETLGQWNVDEPIKLSSGDQSRALGYPCWSAPVVVGDQILVRGDRSVLSLQLPATLR